MVGSIFFFVLFTMKKTFFKKHGTWETKDVLHQASWVNPFHTLHMVVRGENEQDLLKF